MSESTPDAPAVPERNPPHGGRWLRDPVTGELTEIDEAGNLLPSDDAADNPD